MEALYEYAPKSGTQAELWVSVVIALVAFYGCYWALKRKGSGRQHTMNMLYAMLFFFGGIIATSTAFFSGWNQMRVGKVVLFEDRMQIGAAEIPYAEIRKAYLRDEAKGDIFGNSNEKHIFLVVERSNSKVYVIGEDAYPVGEIVSRLRELTQKND